MSSSAESLPNAATPEVIHGNFGRPQHELEVEDTIVLMGLSDENRRFVIERANAAEVSNKYIVDTAVETYQGLCELVDAGGKIFVLGKDGNLHPLGEDSSNPAA